MRNIKATVTKAALTRMGQRYTLTVRGESVYTGRSPYFAGARAMVDEHGYQLDDVVEFDRPDGTRSPPMTLNELYWTKVTETDIGGLRRSAWRGQTQDDVCRIRGVGKDALEGREGSELPRRAKSTPGATPSAESPVLDQGAAI